MFHESEECHTYQGLTFEMIISLTFYFATLVHACLISQVSEKLEMFGKSVQGTKIVVRACCLHTPFKGEAICEYQVEKHKNPENCPSFGVWKKSIRILINEC